MLILEILKNSTNMAKLYLSTSNLQMNTLVITSGSNRHQTENGQDFTLKGLNILLYV